MAKPPAGQVGCVATFTARWIKGTRPVRISVCVERHKGDPWTADSIAQALVHRAGVLLACKPTDLRLKRHPADGFIWRIGAFKQ